MVGPLEGLHTVWSCAEFGEFWRSELLWVSSCVPQLSSCSTPVDYDFWGELGIITGTLFAVVSPTARPPIGKGFKWLGIFYSQRSDWCSSSCGDTCLQVVLASKSQTDSQANMCLSNISDLPHDPWIVPQQYWSQLCVQQMPRIAKQICLHSHIIWCLSNGREDLAILCIWCVTFCRACHQDF